MARDEIHLNDVGVRFIVTIQDGDAIVDVSTCTLKQLLFEKPSGEILTKTAAFYTDGTDGIITYTTIADDLDELGNWELQGYVEFGSSKYHSDVTDFRVHRNLN